MHGETPNVPPSRHRLRQRRWWLAILPLVLVVGYLAGANWLLDTAWMQARLTPQPGLSVSWTGSRSWWPGRLRVESLQLERQDDDLPLRLEVEAATLDLSLLALFSRRLEIRSLEAHGLRSLRVGDHELEGEGRLSLAGLTLEERRVGVERLDLRLETATLRRGREPLANDIALQATAAVAPFAPGDHPGAAAARFLSGELTVAARADAWDLFNHYLGGLDWLTLAGRGSLSGHLALDEGVLAPGSELTLDSPSLVVELDEAALLADTPAGDPDAPALSWTLPHRAPPPRIGERFRLAGAGRVTATVEEANGRAPARLAVALDDLDMHLGELPAPFLTSRHFRLSATLAQADLASPPREPETASLHWEGAEVPDVSVFARYLPASVPFAMHGGSAGLVGRLDYRGGVVSGDFDLVGNDVELDLLGRRISGGLRLALRLPELDPARQRLDLSGTRLQVRAGSRADDAPLTSDLTLHEARLEANTPLDVLIARPEPLPLDGHLVVSGRIDRLGFLDPFLSDALEGRGLELEGGGDLAARLSLAQGRLAPGSRLRVESDDLAARLLDFRASGRGRLVAEWLDTGEGPLARLGITLEEAGMRRRADGARLLEGANLTLTAQGRPTAAAGRPTAESVELAWRDATLPDVAVLNRYLPPAVPFTLSGGAAATHGHLSIEGDGASGALRLAGHGIAGTLFGEAIEGELALDLALREARLDGSRLDLSGTRLELQAGTGRAEQDQRLRTVLVARQARFDHPLPSTDRRGPRGGRLMLEGMVSRLGFLDAFLPEAHGLSIRGNGRLEADLQLRDETLLPGSRLRVDADDLEAHFLDYVAGGRGTLDARIEGEATAPGARLELGLPHFDLTRQGEVQAHLEGRHFTLETTTPDFRLKAGRPPAEAFTTRIGLPIAEVEDLGLYNAYLPESAGLELLAGRASLETELVLEGMRARGDLTLQAFDTTLRLADQHLTGDLRLEARLRDGDLAERRFDASGSLLRLDNISREDAAGRRDAGWWARLDLEEGRLTWSRPLVLDTRLRLAMRDSGLLATLFIAGARERDWLGRLLTVSDIRGNARVRLDDDSLHLHDARLEGGNLTLLADLVMRDETLKGALYARLGALGLGIALEDGDTRLHLRAPRRWYEESRPGYDGEMLESSPRAWHEALEARPADTP
ncbi:hypothetical protein QLQ85_01315 [Halomonas sp. M4R5S39]|uniref:hypothetical protein n=1 Tax=Halomonas kalidii TaxID=3043293 RepID=UPI0024A90386|nr:hypothetical protein [Halomonas kalidii]MDI5983417.1 hypothetical protein [Halomonas kalidii]